MAGTMKKLDNGKYFVRLFIGNDADGKRKYWSKTIDGKKQAETALAEKVKERNEYGAIIEPAKVALKSYLDDWMEASTKGRVTAKTYQTYIKTINLYIMPKLGHLKLNRVTPEAIQKHYGYLQNEYKPDSRKPKDGEPVKLGISPSTIRYAHNILKSALQQAVKWRKIPFNPASLVDLPKHTKTEMKAMTADDVKVFLDAATGDRYKVMFELMVLTGLRPGEALGLKWSDVDYNAKTITVQRTLSRPKNGKEFIFESPKTNKSRRTIPIPDQLIESLKEHRKNQVEEIMNMKTREKTKMDRAEKQGEEYKPVEYAKHDLIFCGLEGTPGHNHNILQKHFKVICEAAGLEGFRLYDLRHTCATLLLGAGEHPKVVAEMLGHASTTMTMDIYSHVQPGMKESASNKLRNLIY